MKSNAQVLKDSVKAFDKIKDATFKALMPKVAENLLQEAISDRDGWFGFTGNLQRSYAAGLYDKGGKLYRIIWAGDVDSSWGRPKVTNKIPTGRTMKLKNPYEGQERLNVRSDRLGKIIRNPTNISFPDGREMSKWFLNQYKPDKEYAIVICTGAEYSQWLEADRTDGKEGVLTGAAQPQVVARSFTMALNGQAYAIPDADLPFTMGIGDTPF